MPKTKAARQSVTTSHPFRRLTGPTHGQVDEQSVAAVSTFTFPNRILFGAGAGVLLAEELARLGIGRPLVVTDAGLIASGLVGQVDRSRWDGRRSSSAISSRTRPKKMFWRVWIATAMPDATA